MARTTVMIGPVDLKLYHFPEVLVMCTRKNISTLYHGQSLGWVATVVGWVPSFTRFVVSVTTKLPM
jgi:hypothetical protein